MLPEEYSQSVFKAPACEVIQHPTHMYFLITPLDLLLATSAHSGILATID